MTLLVASVAITPMLTGLTVCSTGHCSNPSPQGLFPTVGKEAGRFRAHAGSCTCDTSMHEQGRVFAECFHLRANLKTGNSP